MGKKTSKGQHEGLYSLFLDVENFKNIKKMIIEIGGKSFIFLAKNNSGKSTLIQSIMATMDKKVLPSEPILEGEERARITHKIGGTVLGEYREYTIDLYFTLGDKKGRLKIFDEKGEELRSPVTMIKSIIGNVSFDVTKWLNDDKKKKLETIKALTGKGVDIDIINKKISEEKEKIKYKKQRATELEGAVNNHEFTSEEIELYSDKRDTTDLENIMKNISKNQETWDGINNKLVQFKKDKERSEKNISDYEAHLIIIKENYEKSLAKQKELIESEKAALEKTETNITNGNVWMDKNPRPSVAVISDQLNGFNSHNQKHERVAQLANQRREMISARQEVDVISNEIEKMEAARSEIISNSQLPVKGLRFTDDEIYLNNLPLEEGQINTQTLMDISIDIAIALNPTYKGIFIQNGNLFDKQNLKKIVDKIEDAGYFAIIEMVSYEGNELEVRWTEKELA